MNEFDRAWKKLVSEINNLKYLEQKYRTDASLLLTRADEVNSVCIRLSIEADKVQAILDKPEAAK